MPPPPADSSPSLSRWAMRLLVYPMFLASGAAGLIYEVTWTRQLLYTFGAGLYAVSAVLAAFMAGLALGAWLMGKRSDSLDAPLKTYAVLELLIGLCGLLLPLILSRLNAIDGWAYSHWGQNFTVLTAFRFILASAVMLVPTTLMGATLPIVTRSLVRDDTHLGLHIGGLYAINTFGAVLGAFAAGFLLIGAIGMRQTQWLAAGLNFAVAILAFLVSPSADSSARPPSRTTLPSIAEDLPAPSAIRWILGAALVSGLVSLAAQVLWSRALVFSFEYLKNTTYAFSAMLTVFLTGLALGSALMGLLVDQVRRPMRLYGILLCLIGLGIAVSVSIAAQGSVALKLFDPLDADGRLDWIEAVLNIMLQTFGVLGVPTFLMGMAFPVSAKLVARVGAVGGGVGALYSLNTVGAILGSLAAAFVILPLFGLTKGLMLLAAVESAVGLAILFIAKDGRRTFNIALPVTALYFIVLLAIAAGGNAGRLQPVFEGERLVHYEEGSLATVAVVENQIDERTIYVDGVGVAGTDPVLQTDQKSLAHVPMMLIPKPASALTVGFGSGGASYSLLLHDRLSVVDCVEICATVPRAAFALAAANHLFFDVLDPAEFGRRDPKYDIIMDDARAYLAYTEKRYDFISTDCTDLRYKSNANLYDLEYFRACRDRLTSQGLVVVWMPLAGMTEDVFKVALRTFHKVFPQMGVFFMDNEPTHYVLLVGWQDKIAMDYRLFEQTLAEPDVKRDLAELRLDDPVKLLSCFITGGDKLGAWLGDGTLNTENNPYIEFESPKYGYGDQPMIDNLNALMAIRVSPLEFLDPASIPPAERERLVRYEAALPQIIEGHAHYRSIGVAEPFAAIEATVRSWTTALELAPEDLSLRRQLMFPVLSARLEKEPNNVAIMMLYGRACMLQNDPMKTDLARYAFLRAQTILEAYSDDSPDLIRLRAWLAELDHPAPPAP